MTRVMHANSLANLAEPFRGKGDPRGANGRPNAGASIINWMNELAAKPLEHIQAVADDPKASCAKRQAAKSLCRSMSDEYAKNGRPYAADDLDRVLDRTEGKPTQRVAVETRETKDPAALRVELLAVLAEHPELLRSLGDSAARLLAEGVGPPIAGEAAEE